MYSTTSKLGSFERNICGSARPTFVQYDIAEGAYMPLDEGDLE